MNETERQELIASLRDLPARVREVVTGLAEEDLTTPYLPGEWTVAQVVHHLADAHLNAYLRTKFALTEDRPAFKPFDQDAWAELPDAVTPSVEDSLAILEGLHRRWVRLLEGLPEADWQRSGLHPQSGEQTVGTLLRTYARHGENHLAQIAKTLAARGPCPC